LLLLAACGGAAPTVTSTAPRPVHVLRALVLQRPHDSYEQTLERARALAEAARSSTRPLDELAEQHGAEASDWAIAPDEDADEERRIARELAIGEVSEPIETADGPVVLQRVIGGRSTRDRPNGSPSRCQRGVSMCIRGQFVCATDGTGCTTCTCTRREEEPAGTIVPPSNPPTRWGR
jgi:hypothetical protein